MLRIDQLKTPIAYEASRLPERAAKLLGIAASELADFRILRRSIDARKKPELFYVYTVECKVSPGAGGEAREEKLLRRIAKDKRLAGKVSRAQSVRFELPEAGTEILPHRPVIVGMGPAGLFCAYELARAGYRPVLLERGRDVDARAEDVEAFWRTGRLDPASNVQFGEGGAGTFSDGKLNTTVKDPSGRIREVLEVFVKFGAKESILYDAKPHLGTDALRGIVRAMREEIRMLGGEVRFEAQVTGIVAEAQDGKPEEAPERAESGKTDPEKENGEADLEKTALGKTAWSGRRIAGVVVNGCEKLPCSVLILAIGHSARDTVRMLYASGLPMEAKPFAVGLRVEHRQSDINFSQYGIREPEASAGSWSGTQESAKKVLDVAGPAPYKLTARTAEGRSVFSFCMCPGGYVVNSASEEGGTVVNGMSYSGRGGENANSAIVVSVTPEDYPSPHPLAGIEFQRELERRAFALGGGRIPLQRYGVFRECVQGGLLERELCEREGITEADLHEREQSGDQGVLSRRAQSGQQGAPAGEHERRPSLMPNAKGATAWADVSRILPASCSRAFVAGMEQFGRRIVGFDDADVILSGVESRTSSPVRILRGEDLQSAVAGIYPCGEGAGYAGGITSAAVDGIRVAEAIIRRYAPA